MKNIAVIVTLLAAGTAHADGLEVSVGLGAATSTGDVGDGMTAGELIGSAGQLDISVGGRIARNLTLAFYANAQAGDGAYTGAAGIAADLHLRPAHEVDPWVRLGTGVRSYLVSDDGTTLGVGAEVVRFELGTDIRVDKHWSIGPVLGAAATLYGAEKRPMEDFHELSGKGINWTLTAGIAGRFTTR